MENQEAINNISFLMKKYANDEKKLKEIFEQALDPDLFYNSVFYESSRNNRKKHIEDLISLKNSDDLSFILNKKCNICKLDNWTTTSIQIRSADEGETVFFKCTTPKCTGQFRS